MSSKIKFFLPEWNDVVFREYDFLTDEPINKERIYSHELFPNKIFDGLLVSRSYLEETKGRLNRMKEIGVHQFLRFDGEIIGDCGAWSYSKEDTPPFTVKDTIEFYNQIGVDYGVSLDHLCNTQDEETNERRRLLTLKNAESFFNIHEHLESNFVKIGVAQGWDVSSYQESVKELVDMGYTLIGIGGLAGAKTPKIMTMLKGISELNNLEEIDFHLFGVARLSAIRDFMTCGIKSFDSASPLRHSWLGPGKNYKSKSYKGYSAFRLPFVDRAGSKYIKELRENGTFSDEELKEWETDLHNLLLNFDTKNGVTINEIISKFSTFDGLLGKDGASYSKRYVQSLLDKPWKECKCIVCSNLGIEVMIFRGNERNKLRGFHNLYTFYELLQKIIRDPKFELSNYQNELDQTDLKHIQIFNIEETKLKYEIIST